MPPSFERSSEERTEAATAFRREEFRKQGSVALSREVLSVALLFSLGMTLYLASSSITQEFSLLSGRFFKFSNIDHLNKEDMVSLGLDLFKSWGWMVAPFFAVALLVGVLACAAQVGFYMTWEPLTPNWDRLNPVTGFQRVLSSRGAMEALKAVVKLLICVVVVWFFFRAQMGGAGLFLQKTIPEINALTLNLASKLFFTLVFTFSLFAALDYAFQRYQLEKQMRMTRSEAKEEFKLREGDPLIRSRIKAIQRRIASRRMMEAVPKSDVVVTNPTHLAVALKYNSDSMHAPKVTAKGAGFIADKIREIARFHHIPIVENKPLARTLYKELEINQLIPKELYKAVAEVLAYVYRLKGINRVAV